MDKEWCDLLGNLFKASELNGIFAKVASVLYIQPEEISMEELAKETDYSLASVSNSMKILVNMGIVKRTRKPRTKKVFFYMEKDIFKINKQKIEFAYESFIKPVEESMPKLIEKYEKKTKDEKAKKKLKIIKNYYKQVRQFDGVINHMLEKLDELSAQNRE